MTTTVDSQTQTQNVRHLAVPPVMRIGGGALAEVADVTRSLSASRPVIVTDAFLASTGTAQTVSEHLTAAGLSVALFTEAVPDPTTDSLSAGLEVVKDHQADAIIGLGGGSPIDTAKALSVLAVRGGAMSELRAPVKYEGPSLPLIAIPTTAGTGSEATQSTIISDSTSGEKMLCMGGSYLPDAAIVDYELTLTMPARLTADTGLDALTHAVEAYVSQRRNGLSDALALHAIRVISENLRTVYTTGDDRSARAQMMEAATLAGIAFSNSSVALVHAMSRPLGARFRIAHGMANAMLFADVTEYSLGADDPRYADCAKAMRLAAEGDNAEKAARALVAELHELKRTLEVPTPEDFGIDRSDWLAAVPTMAAQAVASGSHLNNPRVPDEEAIESIYRRVYAGGK